MYEYVYNCINAYIIDWSAPPREGPANGRRTSAKNGVLTSVGPATWWVQRPNQTESHMFDSNFEEATVEPCST